MVSPAGKPSRITTSARPCDSPAVRNRSIRQKFYTNFLRASWNTRRGLRGSSSKSGRSSSCTAAATRMPVIAERFLADEDGVVDLATGESIRLTIDRVESCTPTRADACDALFGLRHPLLLPLVDYGVVGAHWFEAH